MAPRNGNGQVKPVIPMVNGHHPGDIHEFRKMLEETKREVREIKAIESQLRWNMNREERKGRLSEAKATVDEIRDWRWKQSEEMKAYKAAKAKENKITELRESKSFQEFKREAKVNDKEEEKRQIREEYLQDREHAQWRAELAKAVHEREKETVTNRIEDYLELRDIRNFQKEQEKVEADENRAFEQSLEMAAIAREIEKEREQLLQTLELSRAAQRAPHRSNMAPTAMLGQLS